MRRLFPPTAAPPAPALKRPRVVRHFFASTDLLESSGEFPLLHHGLDLTDQGHCEDQKAQWSCLHNRFLDPYAQRVDLWQLYTTIRLESPMGWGAWVLMIMTPISIIWAASYMKELFPNWDWKFQFLNTFEAWVIKNRLIIAWPMAIYAVILGIYTGILLSAFNARPLWNTAILGPLFLVSGMSTGAAVILLISKDHKERKIMGRIDILLILIELFFIVHLFMGFKAGSEAQINAANLFLGGSFTAPFFTFVVLLGLIFPAFLEILELRGVKVPIVIPAILILLGGLIFRFLIVEAGQITRYLY